MSNALKCNNCNIVINEVLAFIQNKAGIMDEESMTRLCVTAFFKEEITLAKKLLFESVETGRRKITRRKEGKTQRDIEDIITLIKEIDPELLPIFVARDLHKLPPVTFDHLDATRILRDIIKLQEDVAVIKEKYVTMDDINDTCYRSMKVNGKRGAGLLDNNFEYESGPVGVITHYETKGISTALKSSCESGINQLYDVDDTIVNSGVSGDFVASVQDNTCVEKPDARSGAASSAWRPLLRFRRSSAAARQGQRHARRQRMSAIGLGGPPWFRTRTHLGV